MRAVALGALAVVALATPASARIHSRRHHSAGTTNGMPITAGGGTIRINAVGEVISSPAPVIQKEKSFNETVRRELAKPHAAEP